MATLWGRFSMATLAAYTTFRRVWADPASMVTRERFEAQVALYDYRWHLYQNSVFDDLAKWQRYRTQYGLYRYIRPLYNPTRRLVDFYAGIVYPGVLATDAKRLPDGTQLAIPLAEDIDPNLRNAIGQLWQWSNWQTGKNLYVRYGAALGDVGVEVVDELDRGKVTFGVIWPSLVTDLELDSTGNVKRVVMEYTIEDETGRKHDYRKLMDTDVIEESLDDEVVSSEVNPYSFVPFVWCKHTDLGTDHGNPAIRNVSKIDELNEIASHAHDRTHAVLDSPVVAAGKGSRTLGENESAPRSTTDENTVNPMAGRAKLKVIRAEEGGSMSAVQLPEGEALNYMDKLLGEIEADHPEIVMYAQLREMSQVTGPGADRLVGDTLAYVQEARSNYDTQTIKSHQMAVAIAGWRANTGAWGRNLTRQQQAFLPFGLDSYQKGDLDFEIMPRSLFPPAPKEEMSGNAATIRAARQLMEEE